MCMYMYSNAFAVGQFHADVYLVYLDFQIA